MGNAIAIGLRKGLIDAGVPVHYDTELTGLVIEDGRVVGVRVHARRPARPSIRARRGVILGSGGFEKNLEMREKYQPHPTSVDWTTGSQFNTGGGILAGIAAGAADRPAGRRLVGPDDPAAQRPVVLPGRAQPARLDHRQPGRPAVHERGAAVRRGGARDLRGRGHRRRPRAGVDGHRPALPQPLPLRRPVAAPAVPRPLVQDGTVKKAATLEELAAEIDVPAAAR